MGIRVSSSRHRHTTCISARALLSALRLPPAGVPRAWPTSHPRPWIGRPWAPRGDVRLRPIAETHDGGERLALEAGAADQRAVDVGAAHQLRGVVGLDRAAVLD